MQTANTKVIRIPIRSLLMLWQENSFLSMSENICGILSCSTTTCKYPCPEHASLPLHKNLPNQKRHSLKYSKLIVPVASSHGASGFITTCPAEDTSFLIWLCRMVTAWRHGHTKLPMGKSWKCYLSHTLQQHSFQAIGTK